MYHNCSSIETTPDDITPSGTPLDPAPSDVPEDIPGPNEPVPDSHASPMYARLIQLRQILTDEERRALAYAVLAATETNAQQRTRWAALQSWHARDAIKRQEEIDSLRRLGHA